MAKEEKKNTFEITLADGTQLAGLELNGNNFVSQFQGQTWARCYQRRQRRRRGRTYRRTQSDGACTARSLHAENARNA